MSIVFEISKNGASHRIEFNGPDKPDRLIEFNPPQEGFYTEFYSSEGGSSPLKATRAYQFGEICRRVAKRLPPSNQCTMIDVGAAQGEFVDFARNFFSADQVSIHGIEPYISVERKYLKKKRLEEVDEEFDFVFLNDVFEHFSDPEEKVRKLSEIVAPGGYLVLKVPNKSSLLYRMAKGMRLSLKSASVGLLWRLYQVDYPPPHFFYYNLSTLSQMISTHFVVKEHFYLSEAPLAGAWSRLWGVSMPRRMIVYPLLVSYGLVTRGDLKDGLVIIAQKKAEI